MIFCDAGDVSGVKIPCDIDVIILCIDVSRPETLDALTTKVKSGLHTPVFCPVVIPFFSLEKWAKAGKEMTFCFYMSYPIIHQLSSCL